MKTVLHAGCGASPLPPYLKGHREVRLDIDRGVSPDIVASLTGLGEIGEYDIVFCSHTLEHLYTHEVSDAIDEFYRVLKKDGVLIVWVPDLTNVQCDDTVLFKAPGGWITGKDMYYGFSKYVQSNPYMAHKTGFTRTTLKNTLTRFRNINIVSDGCYSIMGTGIK